MNNYRSYNPFKTILFGILFLTISFILFATTRDQLGDMNNDGEVNILDIVRIVNIILENNPAPTEYELWAGDVNLDDSIDVVDIVIIVQVIIGEDDCQDLFSPCSDNLTTCCPDTTSHEFTWFADTIGMYGSQLKDVAIIDENNIWVVGALTIDDSTLQYPGQTNYNAAQWNGEEWSVERIQFFYMGHWSTALLNSIEYISENDIWVLGSYPLHFDGESWTYYHLTDMGVTPGGLSGKIIAFESDDVLFIGRYGRIIHYDGASFELMEIGTEVDLKDIHGTPDGEHIFAVGYMDSGESIALQLIDNQWEVIYSGDSYFVDPETSIYGRISAVEVKADTAYFTTTAGLLKYVISSEEYIITAEDQNSFYNYHFVDISMNEINDIMLFSRAFSFLHYNGETWFHDEDNSVLYDTWAKGGMFANNVAASVGYCCGGVAYVVRGYRNPR